jgi:HAD superfamily hydrolase (TIGR01509 family)
LVRLVIRGAIFDLDGTLADTERIHWAAYRRVLCEFGVDVGIEEYRRYWIADEGGAEYACRAYRLPMTASELRARKTVHYRALIGAGVRPLPGARDALDRLCATHRLAVATNSARPEVEVIMRHLALGDLLDAIITREHYARPKPDPDAYLAAAAALGLEPSECVVIEDTQRGARAGLAAGMRVIAVPSDLTHDNDFKGCVRRLAGLHELSPALLTEIGGAGEMPIR